MYTGKVAEQLKTMSTDETIEWLYDLLFAETPKREKPVEDEVIPTVIYQKQKDYTTLRRVLLGAFALALVVGAVIFAAKFDFHGYAQRRSRKKQKKTLQKQGSAELKRQPAAQRRAPAPVPATSSPQGPEKMQKKQRRELEKLRRRQEKAARRAYRSSKKADKYYANAAKKAGSRNR